MGTYPAAYQKLLSGFDGHDTIIPEAVKVIEMGTFTTRLGISNGNGGDTHWVEALVDTGATYTVLPTSFLQELLRIRPLLEEVFTLADGRKMPKQVGEARHHFEDREAISRVVFGDEEQYLIGATALQELGLIADTTNHRLIPAPKLLI